MITLSKVLFRGADMMRLRLIVCVVVSFGPQAPAWYLLHSLRLPPRRSSSASPLFFQIRDFKFEKANNT